jgi:hypothetical protein
VDGVVLDIVSGMHGRDDRRVLVIDQMNRANLPRVFWRADVPVRVP